MKRIVELAHQPVDGKEHCEVDSSTASTGRLIPHSFRSASLGFKEVIALITVLIVALGLRLVAVDKSGLWYDEALSIVLSKWSMPEMVLYPTDPTPPLYYVLHQILFMADAPAGTMRMISVAAGVTAVFLMYFLGRLSFGRMAGLISASFLAVWTSHAAYSQEARAYAVLVALTITASIGVLIYAHALDEEQSTLSKRRGMRVFGLVLFGIGNLASFYTHIVSVVWIVLTSLLLLACVRRETRRAYLPELCVLFGLMALCALPGLFWFYQSMSFGHSFNWLQQPTISKFIGELAAVFLPAGFWDNPWARTVGSQFLLKLIAIMLGVACLVAAFLLKGRALIQLLQTRPVVGGLILAYLGVPFVIWGIGFVSQPILMARTILLAIPGLILLLAGFCMVADKRFAVWGSTLLVLVYGSSTLMQLNSREKENWRGAAAFLSAAIQPGDVIVVCPASVYPALRHAVHTPVPASVMAASVSGQVVELEAMLGADPNWDTTYHHLIQVPKLEQRIGRNIVLPGTVAPVATVNVQLGHSVWRVDRNCNNTNGELSTDAALQAIDAPPHVAWRHTSKYNAKDLIAIKHYQTTAPVQGALYHLSPSQ